MGPTANTDGVEPTRVKLSTLWIFLMFNYLYCDVLGVHDAEVLKALMTGSVGGIQMTESFILGASILMEIPMAMVLLSRVLQHRANRWMNLGAPALLIPVQLSSLFVGTPTSYYLFFSAVEVGCLVFIASVAWKWTTAEPAFERRPVALDSGTALTASATSPW